jgi:hypothetical protein
LIISIIALGFLSSFYILLIGYKRIKILIAVIISYLGGMILSLSSFPNYIIANQVDQNYIFAFQNIHFYIFIQILGASLMGLMWYVLIINYRKIRDRKLADILVINTLCFSLTILTFGLFLLIQTPNTKYLHLITYLITALIVFYEILKKPEIFIELTNKIYDFIIFHKSGILLYSYNFETGKETEESLLKGSILIGINHILSNFIQKFDQLNLIKMENRDIVLEYDNQLDYAILLITNQRNKFIEKSIQKFMIKFSEINKKKLNDLNGFIDVSQFKNAKDLIHEFFAPYIV